MKKRIIIQLITAVVFAASLFYHSAGATKADASYPQTTEVPSITAEDFFPGDIEQVRNFGPQQSSVPSSQESVFCCTNSHLKIRVNPLPVNTKSIHSFLYLEKFLSHIYPFHAFW